MLYGFVDETEAWECMWDRWHVCLGKIRCMDERVWKYRFLKGYFFIYFFLRKSIEMPALYIISPCRALCQYDRRVFLQKAKFKGAASRVCSWALWILFKFSKSWEVLISKYFLGSASPLALSSPPDFDTNNLIEKSGRGTGAKNREKKGEVSISAGCN